MDAPGRVVPRPRPGCRLGGRRRGGPWFPAWQAFPEWGLIYVSFIDVFSDALYRAPIGSNNLAEDKAMELVPFDDRDGWIWWDGKLVPWRDAKLHVLTHGLHYASAVFEGERAYNGHIFRLRAHTDRLIASGKILGFDIPYTADEIAAACRETLAANNLVDG